MGEKKTSREFRRRVIAFYFKKIKRRGVAIFLDVMSGEGKRVGYLPQPNRQIGELGPRGDSAPKIIGEKGLERKSVAAKENSRKSWGDG